MQHTKLRWGVLSTAAIGHRAVSPAIRASKNGTLLGVASRDAARAQAFATEGGFARHYGSYEALLDDGDIDAVYIPLPNNLHKEWTIKSLQRGKHVLCEKPLALSAEDCREMQRTADANGKKLMEAFMYRFHPRTEWALALAHDGKLGTLRSIRSAFTFRISRPDNIRLDPTLGGGALLDVGCYCVNIARTVAGAEPLEVRAWSRQTNRGVDAQLTGLLRFPSGLIAHFDCALDMERREFYDIGGTDASVSAEWCFAPGAGAVSGVERRANREEKWQTFAGIDQYRLMVEHFADCALHDRPLRYGADDAAANMAVIEALYASARESSPRGSGTVVPFK
ncbi:MAG TPA: Gfo/Idh/MocA family oxidoreductase [Gemmatimonadaceae bacterium]|nr:Gfo/Idh/MocA family oxidoreductase [Gemmatimonadaceae bacterium]